MNKYIAEHSLLTNIGVVMFTLLTTILLILQTVYNISALALIPLLVLSGCLIMVGLLNEM